jgi:nitrate reductase NapE component
VKANVRSKKKRNDALFMRLFVGIFSVVGVGLVTGGIYAAWQTRQFLRIAEPASGIVTENVWQKSTNPNQRGVYVSYAYPRIEFSTQDGQRISVLQSVSGSNPATYHANQRVTILYDPRDPQHAYIQSFASSWLLPLLLCGIGSVFCFFGFGTLAWKFLSARNRLHR